MFDDILLQVSKPARYIGAEWNLCPKDFSGSEIKFALVFPDLYEVGMSNLGIRIIYSILNNLPGVSCERFFSCAPDMEALLYAKSRQILSLESKRQMGEFDIIGFSLGSELNYSNALSILELGAIPIQSSLRSHKDPLVIAGGPCALNPEPMHEFFDLFCVGEAEDLIPELIEVYRKHKEKFKSGRLSRQDLLFIFSHIEGVYVPSLYEIAYNSEGKVQEFKPKIEGVPIKIKKRFIKDLNTAHFPLKWLVPYIQVIHDRISLEVMRGCPNKCRFCQARSQYYPLRVRSVENLLSLARDTYKHTGYEELSLGGLSVSDYPHIEELLRGLIGLFKTRGVSVSLPSIKAKANTGKLSALISNIKKTSLTFAPEAGTERLRQILAKNFNEGEFFQAIEQSYASGWRHVKLYFMIGLPFEEEKDLDAIIELSRRVSELRREVSGGPADVNISIGTLIPKPHTPLQWLEMDAIGRIKDKQDYLKRKTKNRRLKLKFTDPKMSFLEGVLSRGDRRLSKVILRAFKIGARFDAWGNYFLFEKWQQAFQESGVDPEFYLKAKLPQEPLPWDVINVGINKNVLMQEFKTSCNIKG